MVTDHSVFTQIYIQKSFYNYMFRIFINACLHSHIEAMASQ